MTTSVRLAAFAAALAAVFAVSFGVGRAAGPIERTPSPPHTQHSEHESAGETR